MHELVSSLVHHVLTSSAPLDVKTRLARVALHGIVHAIGEALDGGKPGLTAGTAPEGATVSVADAVAGAAVNDPVQALGAVVADVQKLVADIHLVVGELRTRVSNLEASTYGPPTPEAAVPQGASLPPDHAAAAAPQADGDVS